ncbi:MAG: RNA 2',3'-cyclic phosphodiesterase [Ignavibacteriales bacterium]|nr:RNA 2',3'-cyclic phosphodiesterase [Ignavibacteriales bacterium]
MRRLFVALDLPEEPKREIEEARARLAPNDLALRWEPQSKWHITLKFLGDADERQTEGAIDALEGLRTRGPYECALERFGFFFRNGKPAILWAGARVPETLRETAREIDEATAALGFPNERRSFKPHVTLLRIKRGFPKRAIDEFTNHRFDAREFWARTITLYESRLRPSGSVYTPTHTIEPE